MNADLPVLEQRLPALLQTAGIDCKAQQQAKRAERPVRATRSGIRSGSRNGAACSLLAEQRRNAASSSRGGVRRLTVRFCIVFCRQQAEGAQKGIRRSAWCKPVSTPKNEALQALQGDLPLQSTLSAVKADRNYFIPIARFSPS